MKYSDSYILTLKLAVGIFTDVMFYVMTYISGHQPSPAGFAVLSVSAISDFFVKVAVYLVGLEMWLDCGI